MLAKEMTEIVVIRMPPALYRRLRNLAEEDGRATSNLARVFIEQGCDRWNGKPKKKEKP